MFVNNLVRRFSTTANKMIYDKDANLYHNQLTNQRLTAHFAMQGKSLFGKLRAV